MGDAVEAGFGELVRGARVERGWSQRELADLLGLDTSAISRLEAGTRTTKLTEAVTLSEVLGVPLNALATRKDPVGRIEAALGRADTRARSARTAVGAALRAYVEVSRLVADAPEPAMSALGLAGPDAPWGHIRDRVRTLSEGDPAADQVAVPDRWTENIVQELAEMLVQRVVAVAEEAIAADEVIASFKAELSDREKPSVTREN